MTFAKEVVTASILNSRARFHRVRAARFGVHASSRLLKKSSGLAGEA